MLDHRLCRVLWGMAVFVVFGARVSSVCTEVGDVRCVCGLPTLPSDAPLSVRLAPGRAVLD